MYTTCCKIITTRCIVDYKVRPKTARNRQYWYRRVVIDDKYRDFVGIAQLYTGVL